MPQALSGKRKSMPKVCRILADDDRMIVYRKAGNNHAQPFLWGDSFTLASGIKDLTIASGIAFHGYNLVANGNVVVTPCYDAGDFYIEKDVALDEIIYHCEKDPSVAGTDTIDVQFMLGVDADIEDIYCRGNRGAMPSYP